MAIRERSTNEEVKQFFSTNMESYKYVAQPHMFMVLELNEQLCSDDIVTICTPAFYDDVNDYFFPLLDVLDKHFLGHLNSSREAFIALHDYYNR